MLPIESRAGGGSSCKYYRPPGEGPYRPTGKRAPSAQLCWPLASLVIIVVKITQVAVYAQTLQENQQPISSSAFDSYPVYQNPMQDVQFGPQAMGNENSFIVPTQQTIDQQHKYLAYLIQQQQQQQQQQQIQNQQVATNPHSAFYSLVGEPEYTQSMTGLLNTNRQPNVDQSRVAQMRRHKPRAPTVLTSVQLPNRAHHYKPPTGGSGIGHQVQIDAHHQYRPLLSIQEIAAGDEQPNREQKQRAFSAPLVAKSLRPGPSVAVNLSSLLQPGEVMLSARELHRPHGRAPATVRNSTSVVGVRDIESLLARLKPLALSERDKATNLHHRQQQPVAFNTGTTDSSSPSLDYEEDQEQEQDREDESEMIGNDNDQPAAGPPALFALTANGGSRLTSRKSPGSLDRVPARGMSSRDREGDDVQMASFLQGLKSLGSELLDSPGGREATSSPDYERFYRATPGGVTRRQARQESQQLPVELLVDHLMAGSRLATRGGTDHHARPEVNPVDDPENHRDHGPVEYDYGGGYDDDDDDDDGDDPLAEEEDAERDYEDSPEGGGALGASLLESEESAPDETRTLAPDSPETRTGSHPGNETAQTESELSAANSTAGDSWTPLVGGVPAVGDRREVGVARPSGRGGRKRRRRRRRTREQNGRTGKHARITIGDKSLSREELIRLIGALNKMANNPRGPSEEREASRRLLRLLIKLALANFKRQHDRQGEDEKEEDNDRAERVTNERLRDSLRSMLVEPNLTSGGDNSSTKISIRMQPWRLRGPALSTSQNPLDEDEAVRGHDDDDDDGAGSRGGPKKSLSEISDDLERYFDTDFFEDLADKGNSSSEQVSSAPKMGVTSSQPDVPRRPTVAATNMPVPVVYDRRELEAADEEDVDLDYVRVKSPQSVAATERVALKSRGKGRGRKQSGIGRRRRRRRRRRRGKQSPKRVAAERDQDEIGEVTERRQEESKPVRVRARVKKQKSRRRRRKKRKRRKHQDDREDDRQTVGKKDERREEEEQEQAANEDGGERQGEEEEEEEEEEEDDGQVKQNPDHRPERSENKLAARRQQNRRLKPSKSRNPSRDEVPAPIVAAKMSKETTPSAHASLKASEGKSQKATMRVKNSGSMSVPPVRVGVKKEENKKSHDNRKGTQDKKAKISKKPNDTSKKL